MSSIQFNNIIYNLLVFLMMFIFLSNCELINANVDNILKEAFPSAEERTVAYELLKTDEEFIQLQKAAGTVNKAMKFLQDSLENPSQVDQKQFLHLKNEIKQAKADVESKISSQHNSETVNSYQ